MSQPLDDTVPSPCIKVCQLDAERRYCTACMRTLDEIAGWSQYSAGQKQATWDRLKQLAAPASLIGRATHCEKCGAEFACGADSKTSGCWCKDLPQVLPLAIDGSGCLCPSCLRTHLAGEYHKRGMTPPF